MALHIDGVEYVIETAIEADHIRIAGDGLREWLRNLARDRDLPLAMSLALRAAPAIATIAANRINADLTSADRVALAAQYSDPIDRLCASMALKFQREQETKTIVLTSEAVTDGKRKVTTWQIEATADTL